MNLVKLNALWCRNAEGWEKITGGEEIDCALRENLVEAEVVIDLDRVIQFHPVDADDSTMVDLQGGDAVRLKMSFYEFYSIMSGKYPIDESYYQ